MDLFGFDPPAMDGAAAARLAARHWLVDGAPTRIRGERSANTVITTPDDRRFVLQVHAATERPEVVDLHTAALRHVAERDPSIPVPRLVPTPDGDDAAMVEVGGTQHLARLVTFLPGVTFDDGTALSGPAYEAIGGLIGRIAAALDDFEHPAADHFMPWDIANGLVTDAALRDGLPPDATAALAPVDDRLRSIGEVIPTLPHRTVHNDGHAGNLLRADAASEEVTGVIDFGDLVHTAVAADVAIIAESFAPGSDRPHAVLAAITLGYHRHRPLGDAEIAALPDLVLARAALNVLLVEHQLRHAPHLAAHAAATRAWAIERLRRWHALDRAHLVHHIHTTLESR